MLDTLYFWQIIRFFKRDFSRLGFCKKGETTVDRLLQIYYKNILWLTFSFIAQRISEK